MKKIAILYFLLASLPLLAQFNVISNGPLVGNCPSNSLGLDKVNNNVYSCGSPTPTTPATWKLTSGGGFTAANDLSGNSTSQEVIGILNHPVPALATGFLNYNAGWLFSPAPAGGFTPVSAYVPASLDVGAGIAAAMAAHPGGNYDLGGLTGAQFAYANSMTTSLYGTGSTFGGYIYDGHSTLYIDGPPGGTVTNCSRTGQTVTLTIATLGNVTPPPVGAYIQALGMSGACAAFNNSSAQTTSPQLWQITASGPTSLSFLATASGTIASTSTSGTWQQPCFTDGFGSCMMTPAWIFPTKFGGIQGTGRGAIQPGGNGNVNGNVNSVITKCTGAGAPIAGCGWAHPARSFAISAIAFNCSNAGGGVSSCTGHPTANNVLNFATITLTNDTGTSCGGDGSGCTAVGSTTGTAVGNGATVTVTTSTFHGLFPLTSWVTVSGCAISGYNGYYQVQTTPGVSSFTYTNSTTGSGTGCEIDPHPTNIFLGELAKWTGGSGFPTVTINGQANVSQQQLPPMPIRAVVNGNPPTNSVQTTITVPVPNIEPWLSDNNCSSACGNIVLGTPVIGEGPGYNSSETAQCVKSSCYGLANPGTAFGNTFNRIGIDCQGDVDGTIGFQSMFGNEESGGNGILFQSCPLAGMDFHGQMQNNSPWYALEMLWPVATFCDYGTTGLALSTVPGFASGAEAVFYRSTVNMNGTCAHQPTTSYMIDATNVTMIAFYGSRTTQTSTFDTFLVGQNSNATNFQLISPQGGATNPGHGPSNALVHISNNTNTTDYVISGAQVNGSNINLLVEDDQAPFLISASPNNNLSMYACDFTERSTGFVGCTTTVPRVPQITSAGSAISRLSSAAITAGQPLINDPSNAGSVKPAGAAPGAGTVAGIAYNTVPTGTTVFMLKSGTGTSTMDSGGGTANCSVGSIVIAGPNTGGDVTCGAYVAGTQVGIATAAATAGNPVTYDIQLR